MESVILKSENFISKSGAFDTLMLSKLFKESNFTEQQAEVMSEVLRISQEAAANKASIEIKAAKQEIDDSINKKELTTKQDLSVTEKKLELKIVEVRSDLSLKIEQVRVEIIKWTAGLLLAQTGLLFTLIKVFLH
jgi:hypothetical protein